MRIVFSWRTAPCQWLFLVMLLLTQSQCLSAVTEPPKHYYSMQLTEKFHGVSQPIHGLLRVKDLQLDSSYDRLQLVFRKTPYELTYRNKELWAAKPNRLLSDLLAKALMMRQSFRSVRRDISEERPDYILSGDLQSLEIIAVDGQWSAHLCWNLQITHCETGKVLWNYHFDEKETIEPQLYAMAVQKINALANRSIQQALDDLTEHFQQNNQLSSQSAKP